MQLNILSLVLFTIFSLDALALANEDIFNLKKPAECNQHVVYKATLDEQDFEFTDSYMWKISHPEYQTTNYIFGLVHGVPSSEIRNWDWLNLLLEQSEVYISEIPLKNSDLEVMRGLQITDKSVFQSLSKPMKDYLLAVLESKALDSEHIKYYRPWALSTALSTHTERGFVGIDQMLYATALNFKKALTSLETVPELIKHFDKPALKNIEIDILKDTLCNYELMNSQSGELVTSFVKNKPKQHMEAGFSLHTKSSENSKIFHDVLVNERNKIFVNKLNYFFKSKNTFASFGSLHLFGKNGVLKELKELGYEITPVNMNELKLSVLKNANIETLHKAVEESLDFIKKKEEKFSQTHTKDLRIELMSQIDMDKLFCFGANCNVRAFYKENTLYVSIGLFLQQFYSPVAAQGIILHELTHHAQALISEDSGKLSCSNWKNLEMEALSIQSTYLETFGKVITPNTGIYANSCNN